MWWVGNTLKSYLPPGMNTIVTSYQQQWSTLGLHQEGQLVEKLSTKQQWSNCFISKWGVRAFRGNQFFYLHVHQRNQGGFIYLLEVLKVNVADWSNTVVYHSTVGHLSIKLLTKVKDLWKMTQLSVFKRCSKTRLDMNSISETGNWTALPLWIYTLILKSPALYVWVHLKWPKQFWHIVTWEGCTVVSGSVSFESCKLQDRLDFMCILHVLDWVCRPRQLGFFSLSGLGFVVCGRACCPAGKGQGMLFPFVVLLDVQQ